MKKKALSDRFGKEYARFIAYRESRESVSDQVDFIVEKLGLRANMSILDVGCGNGRHAIELAKRGYRVTAIDSSPVLLSVARRTARKKRTLVKFLLRDALELSFIKEFDAALNMFSFGFFKQREDHQKILNKVSRSLKAGGKFMLVTSNPDYQLKKLDQSTVISKHRLKGRLIETRQVYFNLAKPKYRTIVSISSWKEKGRLHETMIESHIFTRSKIRRMLARAKLKVNNVFSGNRRGEMTEEKPSDASPVLIIVAKKQKG